MEDYIDPFLSSPSWSELNASSKSSWTSTVASQTNGLFDDSVGAYAGGEKNPSICMIPSTHIIGNITTEDLDLHAHSDNSSVFAGGTLKYLSQQELPNNNLHIAQHENDTQESNFPLNAVFEGNSISESYSQELNTSCSITLPHSGLTMSSSIESTGSESCKFAQSFGDANSISSVQSLWPPSPYSSISVSPFVEQRKLQGFDFQGVGNEDDAMGKTYMENGIYSHMNSPAAASLQTKFQDSGGLLSPELHSFNLGQQIKMINGGLHPHKQEQNGIHNLQLPNISTGPVMIPAKSAGLQAHQQPTEANSLKHQTNHSSAVTQQATPVNAAGCNGVAKPRVRARRGQATDPHSIAERLRREKIAERMRNLQELVPNSNKTDKASMLDEIIDYVKFLQLQVKVLSMSRLGAAGAVVPLITDAQAEASNLYLSSDFSEAQDNLAFEQEVVKLMESSVTTAMQFLQNKGLCLMPIALASAISIQKGSSSAAIPQDKRQPDGSKIDREKESYNIYIGGSCKQEEFVRSI